MRAVLKKKESINQRELQEMLDVRSASLSEILGKLERNSFIIRERSDQDKRNCIISVTEQGRAAAEDHKREHLQNAEAIFTPLSTDERQQLGQLLNKIIITLKKNVPETESRHNHHGHRHCHHGHDGRAWEPEMGAGCIFLIRGGMLFLRWLSTILILPLNALFIIPGAILYFSDYRWQTPSMGRIFVATMFAAVGLALAFWTMRLFHTDGQGTPAPWDPPKKFVVHGPYLYVRNPMMNSVFLMTATEMLVIDSAYLFLWFAVFYLGNLIYIPLIEEKKLEKRFGPTYLKYKRNVPRWLPKLIAWGK